MNMDTSGMSNTQELNTHFMAKLLMKEATNVPRRNVSDVDYNRPERGPIATQGSSSDQHPRRDNSNGGNRLPDHLYSQ